MANLFLVSSGVARFFYRILLSLDGIVYWALDTIYQVFLVIANVRIFSSSTFDTLANRIYSVIGIVMLFIIAFQLLTNIADPDKMNSGENSTGAIVKNIITSLIIIVLLPTAFKYMYKIQDLVLKEQIIGNIILGNNTASKDEVNKMGSNINTSIFPAFVGVTNYPDTSTAEACKLSQSLTFCEAFNKFTNTTDQWYGKVSIFSSPLKANKGISRDYAKQISIEIDTGLVEYKWILSTLAGGFCVYILISFALDMGKRVAKLAYYQLIAPIPVAFRIIPKQQKVFDNWVKSLTTTYLEVFIRLIIVYFCAFLISSFTDLWANIFASQTGATGISGWLIEAAAKIVVIIGILMFMKEAPKLISKTFGFEGGDLSLGIGKKLGDTAVFGKGQPLNRENIARLRQNARTNANALKKAKDANPNWGLKDRLAYESTRMKDKISTAWGGQTSEERAAAVDERRVAQLDAEAKQSKLETRQKNIDSYTSANSGMKDTAKELIHRADNPNKIVVDYDKEISKLDSESRELGKELSSTTDEKRIGEINKSLESNSKKKAGFMETKEAANKAGFAGKSYSQMQAIYDSDSTSAEDKALAQIVMRDLDENNWQDVVRQEVVKEIKETGKGNAKIVSNVKTVQDMIVHGDVGSDVTGTHLNPTDEKTPKTLFPSEEVNQIMGNASTIVSNAVKDSSNPYGIVVDSTNYDSQVSSYDSKIDDLNKRMSGASSPDELKRLRDEMDMANKQRAEATRVSSFIKGSGYEGKSYDELLKAYNSESDSSKRETIKTAMDDLITFNTDSVIDKEIAKVTNVGKTIDDIWKKNVMADKNATGVGVDDHNRKIAREKAEIEKRKNEADRIAKRAAAEANKNQKPPTSGSSK